jgi:hypothetical protein
MKKLNFNKRRWWLRIIVVPFIFGIIFVAHMIFVFERTWHFFLYGGEYVNFEKPERESIQEIYNELKVQNELRKKQIELWS